MIELPLLAEVARTGSELEEDIPAGPLPKSSVFKTALNVRLASSVVICQPSESTKSFPKQTFA